MPLTIDARIRTMLCCHTSSDLFIPIVVDFSVSPNFNACVRLGRAKVVTGFSTSRLDAKIKSLLSYRAQLLAELQKGGGIEEVELPYLPGDCWRHIIGFLDRPQDLLNLRCVNRLVCMSYCILLTLGAHAQRGLL